MSARGITYGISSLSLFGLPLWRKFALAKESGFDAIEFIVMPNVANRLREIALLAEKNGLQLLLHQPWSIGENWTQAHNRLVNALGYLPKDGYTLHEHAMGVAGVPMTIYADRHREAAESAYPIEWRLQTVSVFERGTRGEPQYKLPWNEYLASSEARAFPVSFDTLHVLEWQNDVPDVEGLTRFKAVELAYMLLHAWRTIGPERVAEVHWNDFIPALGRNKGRNVWPGVGILANGLVALAQEMKKGGWSGTVIPEIPPQVLFPYRVATLRKLRNDTAMFFR